MLWEADRVNVAEDSASRRGEEIGFPTGGGGGGAERIGGETEGFSSGDLSGVGCEACFAFLYRVISTSRIRQKGYHDDKTHIFASFLTAAITPPPPLSFAAPFFFPFFDGIWAVVVF